jgi:hypothetical protein
MDKETTIVLKMLAFQYPHQKTDWPTTESEEEAEDFFQRNSLNEMGQTPEETGGVGHVGADRAPYRVVPFFKGPGFEVVDGAAISGQFCGFLS